MRNRFILALVTFGFGAFAAQPTAPIRFELKGPAAHFDFMMFDPVTNRILAAHKGANALEVLDLGVDNKTTTVAAGDAQGLAIDSVHHRYFTGNDEKKSISVIDSTSLKKIADIPMPDSVDAIALDLKNGLIYAAQDHGSVVWVVDPDQKNVTSKIQIPGSPEVIAYDTKTDFMYLNIKDKNLVVRIDTKTNEVDRTWSTQPAKSPHGLAIDSERGRLYVAGGNGTLVAVDATSGRILSSVGIPEHADQIEFDAFQKTIYSACKGLLGVSKDGESGLENGGTQPLPAGAHTLAVDTRNHHVWVSYSDGRASYLERIPLAAKIH